MKPEPVRASKSVCSSVELSIKYAERTGPVPNLSIPSIPLINFMALLVSKVAVTNEKSETPKLVGLSKSVTFMT